MVEILTSEINSIYVSLEIPHLTFDPVALVEVDLPLGLGCIRTNHYEVSSWNCTVQLPSGSNCLSTTAGAGRKKKNVLYEVGIRTDIPNSTGVQEIVVLVMYYITHVVSLVKKLKNSHVKMHVI